MKTASYQSSCWPSSTTGATSASAPTPGSPFLDDLLAGAYRTETPTPADLTRCRELQTQYREHSLGVVDASVLALLQRLGETRLATLDHRHFAMLRPAHAQALRLLP